MKALKRILVKLKNLVVRPFAYLSAEWSRLSVRERRLLSLLGASFIGCAVLLVGYLVLDAYQGMSEENQDLRDAIDAIAKHSDEYREAKARVAADALRVGSEPPQLAATLEAAAGEAGIQIPETADRPDAPAGKNFVEHSLDVKLRKVDLKSLATFLNKVEAGRALVLITRLEIRRSFGGDGNSVDVELTAATYERLKEGSKHPSAKGAVVGKAKG